MRMSNTPWFFALLLCILAGGAGANAQGLSPAAPAAGAAYTRDLTIGKSGSDVSALQQFLITDGFLKIPAPTGYFGSLTRAALGAWQASTGLSPAAGYFGPLSRGKMSATVPPAPAAEAIRVPDAALATTTAAAPSMPAPPTNDGSPAWLVIPKLSVTAHFQYNDLAPDGTIEIPTNIVDVGWYIGSPRPGERGASVITGHVAQIRKGVMTKPGVFYALNELRPGDKLYVLDDAGKSIAFVVRESRSYDPAADATDVFTSSDSRAHLNIITCEGFWNQSELSYSQRLVVFADAVQ